MWFNVKDIVEVPCCGPLQYPKINYKYADVDKIYSSQNDFVKSFIDNCPLVSGYKRTLIDIKVQNLKPNSWTCIPGWHVDAEVEDILHLFVANGPTTEFLKTPLYLDCTTKKYCGTENDEYFAINPFTTNTYHGTNFHRGVKTKESCKRLLMRITQTNTILPNNKPTNPYYG